MASLLPQERINLGVAVTHIDTNKKVVSLDNGDEAPYDVLISSVSIDALLGMSDLETKGDEKNFRYSSSNIFGIGLKGKVPPHLESKCWMYFPEDDNPFYRVTVFSNYSPNNVPDENHWSLMAEVSESEKKPVNRETLMEEVVQGLVNTKLVADPNDIVSKWSYHAEHGYPTPFLGRDDLLEKYQPEFKRRGVFSRGRFGAWKYEVSNQDHSFMQGVEAVDNAFYGTPELTFDHPEFVNTNRIR